MFLKYVDGVCNSLVADSMQSALQTGVSSLLDDRIKHLWCPDRPFEMAIGGVGLRECCSTSVNHTITDDLDANNSEIRICIVVELAVQFDRTINLPQTMLFSITR